MVSHIFASVLSALDRQQGPLEQQRATLDYHLAPFEGFIRELWWDVARNPSTEDLSGLCGVALEEAQRRMARSEEEAAGVLKQLLQGMVADAYTLLSELFRLGERGLTERLSEEYVARWVMAAVLA